MVYGKIRVLVLFFAFVKHSRDLSTIVEGEKKPNMTLDSILDTTSTP